VPMPRTGGGITTTTSPSWIEANRWNKAPWMAAADFFGSRARVSNGSSARKTAPEFGALVKVAPEKPAKLIDEADVIFCLDFNSLSRINELGEMVKKSPAKKVLIDHHLEPESFADFEQWDVTAASTAELVYRTIVELNDKDLIDASIAECLYAGIMTDTGGFRHPNTTQNVFNVAADLVAHGADPARISKLIYDTNSLERLRLLGLRRHHTFVHSRAVLSRLQRRAGRCNGDVTGSATMPS